MLEQTFEKKHTPTFALSRRVQETQPTKPNLRRQSHFAFCLSQSGRHECPAPTPESPNPGRGSTPPKPEGPNPTPWCPTPTRPSAPPKPLSPHPVLRCMLPEHRCPTPEHLGVNPAHLSPNPASKTPFWPREMRPERLGTLRQPFRAASLPSESPPQGKGRTSVVINLALRQRGLQSSQFRLRNFSLVEPQVSQFGE